MLIGNSNSTSKQMDILIGLVIAMFLITAAYVGFHASQEEPAKEVKGHNVVVDLETYDNSLESTQILQQHNLSRTIII